MAFGIPMIPSGGMGFNLPPQVGISPAEIYRIQMQGFDPLRRTSDVQTESALAPLEQKITQQDITIPGAKTTKQPSAIGQIMAAFGDPITQIGLAGASGLSQILNAIADHKEAKKNPEIRRIA